MGFVDGEVLVDLDYSEDSRARVDLNVVATLEGELIEVQGTAEGRALPRSDFDRMLDAALVAIRGLGDVQKSALDGAGADLRILMKKAER